MFHLMCSKMHALSENFARIVGNDSILLSQYYTVIANKKEKKKGQNNDLLLGGNCTSEFYYCVLYGPSFWAKKNTKMSTIGGKKRDCFCPGSNRGPCACEAHVITATPQKRPQQNSHITGQLTFGRALIY